LNSDDPLANSANRATEKLKDGRRNNCRSQIAKSDYKKNCN